MSARPELRSGPWYAARDNIADLLQWLADRGQLNGVDEAIYLIQKPWKWESEFHEMVAEREREGLAA